MHAHDHSHGHSHPSHDHLHVVASRGDERRRLGFAIVFTLTILVVEVVGGIMSGSLALLSDAGHMLVDALSLALSYVALRIGERPTTDRFTYGFRRIEILAALLNGVTLLLVCAWIAYEGVERLLHPAPIDTTLMLGVALVGITANIVSAVLLRHAHSLNARSAFLHVLGDLASSVGIVVAALCMMVWDVPWLDPALSIAIAVVVLVSAYRLTREAVGVLMEAAPDGIDAGGIRARLEAVPWVESVHDLHVWTITSGLPALSCHVVAREGAGIAHADALRELTLLVDAKFGIAHVTFQIEPDGYTARKSGCTSC